MLYCQLYLKKYVKIVLSLQACKSRPRARFSGSSSIPALVGHSLDQASLCLVHKVIKFTFSMAQNEDILQHNIWIYRGVSFYVQLTHFVDFPLKSVPFLKRNLYFWFIFSLSFYRRCLYKAFYTKFMCESVDRQPNSGKYSWLNTQVLCCIQQSIRLFCLKLLEIEKKGFYQGHLICFNLW